MHLIHVALLSRSVENADRFYENLLELEKQTPKTLAGSLSGQIFELPRDKEFTIINYMGPGMHFEIFIDSTYRIDAPPVAHVCIEIGDLVPFLEKCRKLQVPVRRIPKGDKTLTFISDFDGNLFEVIGT
jgi:catechol 2,3-dioxygenase-like lactoylglutathione lyase family enzyme